MNILVIGDPHFRPGSIPEADLFVEKVKSQVAEKKPDLVVILGDLANDFERLHISVSQKICELFIAITQTTKLFYIVGNHDSLSNRVFLDDDHNFNSFKTFKNVTIVDRVLKYENLVFVPYVPPGRFEEALNTIEGWKDAAIIFGHQEFRGVQLGPIASTHGDEWPLSYPWVVSGHIHEKQWLQPNIYYPGSPFAVNFGEDSDKTVAFINTDQKRFPIEVSLGMPVKITVELSIKDTDSYVAPANTLVRIILSGTSEELEAFRRSTKGKVFYSRFQKIIAKSTNEATIQRNPNRLGFIDLLKQSVDKEGDGLLTLALEDAINGN